MSKALTTGSPWRVIATFAVPLLIGNVVQQLYHFVDAIVVGRVLGVESLAAVGATGSLLFLLIGFAWGTTSGFAIPTAQAFGAGDHAAVRRSVATGALLTGLITAVLTVGAPLLAEPALRLLRTPEELLPEATTFALISFLGAASTMFFNFLSSVIRATGDSRTPLVFLTVSCVINIGLVVALVSGLGTGVGGAALATVASQGIAVALCLLYVWRRVPVLHVRREDWRVTRADVARHLQLGLPMGFQASIIAIGALAVQVRLNSLGPEAVAAYTTAGRVDMLAVTLLSSLGLAMSMFVAQNLGAGRPDRIRAGVVQGVWMAVAASVVLGAVLIVAGGRLVGLFVGDGEQHVVELATYLLVVNGALYVVLGVLMVLRGALQGLGHTMVPTLTGLVELVMRVGAAVVLGAAFGFEGVVWGNPLAWLGAVAGLVPAYVRAHRRLASAPVAPLARVGAMPEPVALEGPSEGAMVVDAVVPQPRAEQSRRDGAAAAREDAADETRQELREPAAH
ncbi:MATE family efflux transporter [Cellulomonas dongxiuzhuiae]|uniref:MATE family efflux transporter n=1 Tax=Cellulomonas dongxiuzhuiae TaxID=2819979 RepID=A0ABX8GJR1_9CELL|nr:MATE family efflux transporter [Cellulomonas dongxiuzhuiae]MBO3094848.1 MATE family efflux transporter [Cellulomonas dongxiuzhuiae]QWC15881.1 MATE family efflux transporter [Cellulomonas dongxiuzhuiae]